MSDEVNELLDAFLSLCLEQRKLSQESDESVKLKASALELAQKLYIKAAELERSGDISRGKIITET